MQGTDYSLRMSASTRGGQGLWSPSKRFRTHGEARIIDMEAFLTTGPSTLPSLLPSQPEQPEGDLDVVNRRSEYKVPDKIVDFRGQGLVKAIRLSWRIKWRRQRTSQRQVGWYDGDSDDSEDEVIVESGEGVNHLPEAPNVMLRLIWWEGDSEPAEEMISASFSSYTLHNLRAGTPYHFRLIAIIPGEDGPLAHTVSTPKYRNKDNQDASRSHPIPVNLLVYRITPTEATLQWELPPDSHISGIMGYQVRYQATRRSDSEGDFISILASALPPNLVNISDPSATGVTLRHLHPETVYEFAVRAISRVGEPTKFWSMVQVTCLVVLISFFVPSFGTQQSAGAG
ncbi:unnamed protein product [Rodentolepis nana]|uniref:Fibronectin type-III domain-containing protein n=1 Tax=Rodentolepis nana TaxID=102285 RepID=A0A0R3TUC1_RODNA|nr:unnamed protein product [Rodentolepis nana]